MPTERTVAVAGATGRFGGIVDELIGRGHHVRALTRDPASPAGMRLREAGAEVLRADFDQPETVAAAAAGADALFASATAHRAGPDGELRHGLGLADAAAAARVAQLVYVSGDGAAADSPLPLFRGKFAVEERIRSAGVPHTIVAPVYMMENLFNPWNRTALAAGVLPSPIAVEAPLQQVAVADVVAFAALAIEQLDRFAGRRVAIASDEVTALDAAAAIADATGVRLEPRRVPSEELPPGLRALFAWLADHGHAVDIDGLRRDYPEVGWHRYREWVARSGRDAVRRLAPA
jgi:uncharacterized protein YbjT (DUF2867 family)